MMGLAAVLRTVEFDDQLRVMFDEIEHMAVEGRLPPEMASPAVEFAQGPPKTPFVAGGSSAQFAGPGYGVRLPPA